MDFAYINTERIIADSVEEIENGEITALARSICRVGILVPLTVTPLMNTDRFQVVSGVRRLYAARLVGLEYLPCVVIESNPILSRLIVKKGENTDMFAEAEFLRQTAMLGVGFDEISESTGYTKDELVRLIRLTKLTEFEREMLKKNGVSKPVAMEVAFFDDIKVRTSLFAEIINKRKKYDEVIALCEREKRGKRRAKAMRSPKFRDMRLFDNTLSHAVSLLRDAGVNAKLDTSRLGDATEYKVLIKD